MSFELLHRQNFKDWLKVQETRDTLKAKRLLAKKLRKEIYNLAILEKRLLDDYNEAMHRRK